MFFNQSQTTSQSFSNPPSTLFHECDKISRICDPILKRYTVSANTLLHKRQKTKEIRNNWFFVFNIFINYSHISFITFKQIQANNSFSNQKSIVMFNFPLILRTDWWLLSQFSQIGSLWIRDFENSSKIEFLNYSFKMCMILKVRVSSLIW